MEYEIKLNRKHNKENVPVAKMLRKSMTPEEKKLWYRFLSKYPVRFKKQKPFGPFVLDFYCAETLRDHDLLMETVSFLDRWDSNYIHQHVTYICIIERA